MQTQLKELLALHLKCSHSSKFFNRSLNVKKVYTRSIKQLM